MGESLGSVDLKSMESSTEEQENKLRGGKQLDRIFPFSTMVSILGPEL